jgi:hypothetical protein
LFFPFSLFLDFPLNTSLFLSISFFTEEDLKKNECPSSWFVSLPFVTHFPFSLLHFLKSLLHLLCNLSLLSARFCDYSCLETRVLHDLQ